MQHQYMPNMKYHIYFMKNVKVIINFVTKDLQINQQHNK